MPASAPAILIMHLNDAPEPPSRRRPDLPIPPALEAIALRCLEKNPAQRFQTAEEFSDALERAVPADAAVAPRASPDADTALAVPPLSADTASLLPLPAAPSIAVPPPLPTQEQATRPTVKAQEAEVVPAAIPSSRGRGQGRLIAVLLGAAALSFLAVALGGYAAYRVWTSPSRAITAETVSSDAGPRNSACDGARYHGRADHATGGTACDRRPRGRSRRRVAVTAPARSERFSGSVATYEHRRSPVCSGREGRPLRSRRS